VQHVVADDDEARVVAAGAVKVRSEEVCPVGAELHMCVDRLDVRAAGLCFAVIKSVLLGIAIAYARARAGTIAPDDGAARFRLRDVGGLRHSCRLAY
jgi:hypothetical protein